MVAHRIRRCRLPKRAVRHNSTLISAPGANIKGIAVFPSPPRRGGVRGAMGRKAPPPTSRQAQGGNRRETAIAQPDPQTRPAVSKDALGRIFWQPDPHCPKTTGWRQRANAPTNFRAGSRIAVVADANGVSKMDRLGSVPPSTAVVARAYSAVRQWPRCPEGRPDNTVRTIAFPKGSGGSIRI